MLTMFSLALATAMLPQHTDTTLAVSRDARLDVHDLSGSITVTGWDRDAVRIRAEHSSDTHIEIRASGAVVHVRGSGWRGAPTSIDYEITVPAGMAVTLGGMSADITVDGVRGEISAQSVEGDLTVKRAGGNVSLNTVNGDIALDGGRGSVRIHGVSGDVRVTGAHADLSVETIDGDVTLRGIDAANVDASTVDGDIRYDGTIQDNGEYHLQSHDGDVTVTVPPKTNATVSVSTFDGDFDSAFPVQITRTRPGRRFSFQLGNGSARLDLESFDGAIRLRRP